MHMSRIFRTLWLLVTLFFFLQPVFAWAEGDTKLSGDNVASITHMFQRNHYNRVRFNDEQSREMLKFYLERFDPGHYYFFRKDINEFKRNENRLDEMVRRGSIDFAFSIFKRFQTRMRDRDAFIKKALKSKFDLKKEDSFEVDRKKAPYPKDEAEARKLWQKKLKFELLELVLSGQTKDEAKESLRKRYRSIHFRLENYRHNDIVTAFLNAFTAVYDPHSSYLSADELENFNISMRLSLEGIGATLRWEDGYTVISSIIPGGAAAREGTLQPEDKIISVGQGATGTLEDVTNQRLIDVVKLIRGHRGTTVRLSFVRKVKGSVEKRQEVFIVRDKIELKDSAAVGEHFDRIAPGGGKRYRVGVINLPSFYVDFAGRQTNPENYKSASRDVEKILSEFVEKNVDGLILDLRNNGGGGLEEAVSLAGLFISRGPVVMVKDIRGRISTIKSPQRRPLFKGPMIVLINRYSASASEIVAGALQDYGRALIVGDRATFGKGTVQNIISLPNNLGALKTTVAKFYRPGSSSTQNRGVESDLVLPSLNNHLDIGESSLDNALPWDTVQKATFTRWGNLDGVIPILQAQSKTRIAKLKYFKRVNKDIREYLKSKKNRNVVTVSKLRKEIQAHQDDETTNKKSKNDKKIAEIVSKISLENDTVLEETVNVLADYIKHESTLDSRSMASGQN